MPPLTHDEFRRRVCGVCWCNKKKGTQTIREIAPGINHICTRSERNSNIVQLVKSVSARSRGQIVSQALKGLIILYGSIQYSK